MTSILNPECEAAIAALCALGVDKTKGTEVIATLHRALPEATREDLTQMALSTLAFNAASGVGLQFRLPDEFRSILPHLTKFVPAKLKPLFGLRN